MLELAIWLYHIGTPDLAQKYIDKMKQEEHVKE